jgi:hypothetical protein
MASFARGNSAAQSANKNPIHWHKKFEFVGN